MSELLVSEERRVYANVQNLGNTLNPELDRINNLPLNFEESILLNNFDKEKYNESINGGFILIKIMPNDSLGGNFSLFRKCLSRVNRTLSSEIANSNICLSLEPNETLLISYPSLDNVSMNSIGIFSSANSGGFLESDECFIFNSFRGIIQSRKNGMFTELRKISFEDFINSNPCSKQFYYLPSHDSGSFECRSTSANLTICNNIRVNFNSHCNNYNNKDYLNISIKNRSLRDFKHQKSEDFCGFRISKFREF